MKKISTISEALAAFIGILRTGNSEFGIPIHNAPDLLDRWSIAMETQLNVNASLGNPTDVKGVFEWKENPEERFWPLRIPKAANTENPVFEDRTMPYSLTLFAQGIGCTGWDWKNQVSKWVGFDFDTITSHAVGVGVSDDELKRVSEAAQALPWVEVRRSTGGKGLHLYVPLDDVPTANHTEHAALGRCVLGMMSSETGFDFASRIDACGGNMWIWHRKMTTENRGLELIKAVTSKIGEVDLPTNWRDQIQQTTTPEAESEPIALTADHQIDLDALAAIGHPVEWVAEKNCGRTHTMLLGKIVRRGRFETNSKGEDLSTPNCFIFPLAEGWRVVRYTAGTKEHSSWTHGDWTWTYLNRRYDLDTAAKEFGGQTLKGEYVFPNFDAAHSAVAMVVVGKCDAAILPVPDSGIRERQVRVSIRTDNHGTVLVCKIKRSESDKLPGWVEDGRSWVHEVAAEVAINHASEDQALQSVAYVVQPDKSGFSAVGYAVKIPEGWQWISADDLTKDLIGKKIKNPTAFIARAMQRRLHVDYTPFKEVRYENKLNFGCRYACQPADQDGLFLMTSRVLKHIGRELDGPVSLDAWCRANRIRTGSEFLIVVIANWLQRPELKSPLLFLHGPEDSGKSTLHDLVSNLIDPAGIAEVEKVMDGDRFDDHLAGAVIGVIDEPDASSPKFRAKIRKWITEDRMWVNGKYRKAIKVTNYLHWIQMANNIEYAPAGAKDTRVIYLKVPRPENPEDRDVLKAELRREAPFFLRYCLGLKLPKPIGRFSVPVITTESKARGMEVQVDALDAFLQERCEVVAEVDGEWQSRIPSAKFDKEFNDYLEAEGQRLWTPAEVHRAMTLREMPYKVGTGRKGFIHNVRWKEPDVETLKEPTTGQTTAPSVSA